MEITKEQQRRLAKLSALEAGGVDNWEFYDDALTEFKDTVEKEEKLEQLMEDIEVVLAQGAYEPSERGAGYSFTKESLEEAFEILKKGIEKLITGK